MTHLESDTRSALIPSSLSGRDSSMAMMNSVHVWFRPFRDELSRRYDDGIRRQIRNSVFRRINGEIDPLRDRAINGRLMPSFGVPVA